MIPPPSPALSACDPLDGIDDLEAFLAAMGPLSHFPTPPVPSKKDSVVGAIEILEELAQREVITRDCTFMQISEILLTVPSLTAYR